MTTIWCPQHGLYRVTGSDQCPECCPREGATAIQLLAPTLREMGCLLADLENRVAALERYVNGRDI